MSPKERKRSIIVIPDRYAEPDLELKITEVYASVIHFGVNLIHELRDYNCKTRDYR